MTSVDGLISGLDTTRIIEGLLEFQRRPIARLSGKIEEATQRKAAITTISARLLSLQLKVRSLSSTGTFNAVDVNTSNENVLRASGTSDLSPGSYRFRVKQLAQAEQYTATGFSAVTDTVGAGTLKIETGLGNVDRKTELDVLNGGAGVSRGSVRITNKAGTSAVVDFSTAVTVDDVIEKINDAGINVSARIARSATAGSGGTDDTNVGEALVLVDGSGGAGNIIVSEVNGGGTAADLGLKTAGESGTTVQGSQIIKLGGALKLSALNDGLGVRVNAGNDFKITARDGDTVTVDLSTATTVQDVLDLINDDSENDSITASVSGSRFVLTDSSTGGTLSIAAENSSDAITDLGLTTAASGGTLTGTRVLADLNSVLLKTIGGGSFSNDGDLTITNRDGNSFAIDVDAYDTLGEVIDQINSTATSVTATYASSGFGLLLTDSTGGSNDFIVAENGGTVGSQLGVLGTVSTDKITGGDLNPKYIGENTRLSTLNGGSGVSGGKIRITDAEGSSAVVDLSQETTIGDVLSDINGLSIGVTASINSTGNGILLTADTAGTLLKVEEVDGGSTAKDLNILGSGTSGTIDGSFERTITIAATDTLEDVVEAINALDIGVNASIANDGSAFNPFRLQLIGEESGSLARVLVNTSSTNLSFSRTSQARDGILFYGSTEGSSQPVVVRAKDNRFTDVVKGLTVTALATSNSEVVVSANRDTSRAKDILTEVAEVYNAIVADIKQLTRVDPDTNTRGLLLGDSVLRRIERQITDVFTTRVFGLSAGKNLASNIGVRFESNGTMSFDSSVFDSAVASDRETALRLFTKHRTLENSTKVTDFGNGDGLSLVSGADLKVTTRDGTEINVDLNGDLTVADLISSFQTDGFVDSEQKIELSISADGRSLVLSDNTSGSTAFKVSAEGGSGVYKELGLNVGPDVSGGGTITGTQIDLTDDPGIALTLEEIFKGLLDTSTGALTLRADGFQDEIDDLKEEIERREEIMAIRELTLRQQFAQLEVLLGQNQNEQRRLSAALSGIPSIS